MEAETGRDAKSDMATYEALRALALGLPCVGGAGNWWLVGCEGNKALPDGIADGLITSAWARLEAGNGAIVITDDGRAALQAWTEESLRDGLQWVTDFAGRKSHSP
jgi:hypothetical protein